MCYIKLNEADRLRRRQPLSPNAVVAHPPSGSCSVKFLPTQTGNGPRRDRAPYLRQNKNTAATARQLMGQCNARVQEKEKGGGAWAHEKESRKRWKGWAGGRKADAPVAVHPTASLRRTGVGIRNNKEPTPPSPPLHTQTNHTNQSPNLITTSTRFSAPHTRCWVQREKGGKYLPNTPRDHRTTAQTPTKRVRRPLASATHPCASPSTMSAPDSPSLAGP
jgi:hypothetical protein